MPPTVYLTYRIMRHDGLQHGGRCATVWNNAIYRMICSSIVVRAYRGRMTKVSCDRRVGNGTVKKSRSKTGD
jgi:hypothetical protein